MAIKTNPAWKAPRVGAAEIKLLEKLSNASGVAGDESAIRAIVIDEIKNLVDEYHIDTMGNVLATKSGKGRNRPRVMLAAHMDEVGFMLTHDEGDGIFQFATIGGIDNRQLAGKPVWVGPKQTPGVIGAKPIHLTTASEQNRSLTVEGLRIDIGPGNGGKAKVGDRATFATKLIQSGPSIRGKALDDRLGVANLIALLKYSPQNIDLLAAFTVQEEMGLRGAIVAGYSMQPDIGIAMDCTPAMDMPTHDGTENTLYRSKVDQGPAIYVGDGGTLGDPRLIRHFIEVGEAYNIPYQIRQAGGGSTDAGTIHKSRSGVPSLSISVPGRYLHTAAAIIRLRDWKNTLGLLHAGLSHLTKNTLKGDRA